MVRCELPTTSYHLPVQIESIEPVYYCVDQGTGVALIRAEDVPNRSVLIDFMRDSHVIRPGAVVPVHWRQLWDYRHKLVEVPGLFRWPEFQEWIEAWPEAEEEFKSEWRRYFGMPGEDLADAAVVVWEEK